MRGPVDEPARLMSGGAPVRLPRTDFPLPDGRTVRIYGEVPGAPPETVARRQPAELHLRRDELTATWIAVSPARNVRPHRSDAERAGLNDAAPAVPGSPAERFACPLCPGGPELPVGYEAAVFDNRFPSLVPDPPPVPDSAEAGYAPALGRCEVVMFTHRHEGNFATLTPAETARVIAVWRDRTSELWEDPRNAFVMPFENRGAEIGATLSHPHGQLYAFGHLPPMIERRVAALVAGRARRGSCLTCAVVARELGSGRIVQENPHWAIGVPFAARWPYEVHVRAIRHGARRLADLGPDETVSLAGALHGVVERYNGLFGFELPYMMVVQEAPRGADDWHLGIELYPPHRTRDLLKIRASVETATGLFINDTLPEASAKLLAAIPTAPRKEHPGFVVERTE
ncbi:MAG: galactose-1-phosphate uridylyltransferase [Candidatus Limnocylindrales bacterium]